MTGKATSKGRETGTGTDLWRVIAAPVIWALHFLFSYVFAAIYCEKAGRDAARAGRVDEMRDLFNAHLDEPDAQLALAQATELATTKRVALLCYEDDPNCCHRQIVADEIRRRLKCEVVDL